MSSVRYSNPIKVEIGSSVSMKFYLLPVLLYGLGKNPCLAEDPVQKLSFIIKVQSDFYLIFHLFLIFTLFQSISPWESYITVRMPSTTEIG